MSKLYNLTEQIHELLPQINQKYGLKIEIESDYYIDSDDSIWDHYANVTGLIPAIQDPQLLQILVGLEEVLCSDKKMYRKLSAKMRVKKEETYFYIAEAAGGVYYLVRSVDDRRDHDNFCFNSSNYFTDFETGELAVMLTKDNPAKTLCHRWRDGLEPLFNREPEKVLKELVEILKNLLK